MANIEIKRGQQTQVDIKYTYLLGSTYTKNYFNATTLGSAPKKFRHKASLVLRRKTNQVALFKAK